MRPERGVTRKLREFRCPLSLTSCPPRRAPPECAPPWHVPAAAASIRGSDRGREPRVEREHRVVAAPAPSRRPAVRRHPRTPRPCRRCPAGASRRPARGAFAPRRASRLPSHRAHRALAKRSSESRGSRVTPARRVSKAAGTRVPPRPPGAAAGPGRAARGAPRCAIYSSGSRWGEVLVGARQRGHNQGLALGVRDDPARALGGVSQEGSRCGTPPAEETGGRGHT